MKTANQTIVLLVLFVFLSSCTKHQNKTDWHRDKLHGKVKSYTERVYLIDSTKVKEKPPVLKSIYNQKGKNIKRFTYDSQTSKIYDSVIYKYDKKNRLIETKNYTDGRLTNITKCEYNEKGYTTISTSYHAKETLGSPKDTIIHKSSYKEDKYGYITERRVYKENGDLEFAYYPKYDRKGNKIEEQRCKANGVLMFTYKYEYDKHRNLIRSMICQRNGQIKSDYKTFYTYDEFDEKGNWTKMTSYNWVRATEDKDLKPNAVLEREYEYYE